MPTLQQDVALNPEAVSWCCKSAWARGGSKLVACEHVRATHGRCKGDASHLPSSGLPEAYPASLEQCIIFQSASGQGLANRVSIRSAPESSTRPSGSMSAAWSCNTTALGDFRCRSACGSQSAHHQSATCASNMAARMPQRLDM
jgi:hypothetical protein